MTITHDALDFTAQVPTSLGPQLTLTPPSDMGPNSANGISGRTPIPRLGFFCPFFADNCMKMKEFGPGVRVLDLRSANASDHLCFTFEGREIRNSQNIDYRYQSSLTNACSLVHSGGRARDSDWSGIITASFSIPI